MRWSLGRLVALTAAHCSLMGARAVPPLDTPGEHVVHVRDIAVPRDPPIVLAASGPQAKQLTPGVLATPDVRIYYPVDAASENRGRTPPRPFCTPAGCVSADTVGSGASSVLRRIFRPLRRSDDEGATSGSAEQVQTFPLVAFVHPLYGSTLEQWVSRNDALLRHMASHGYVVLTSLWVPGECGIAGVSAADGVTPCSGLPPGQYPLETYLRVARHTERVLKYVNGGNVGWLKGAGGGDGRSAFPSIGIVGYSVGGALAAWLAERAHHQPTATTRVDAVVALAPTVGRDEAAGGNGARGLFVNVSNAVPHLILVGNEDGMGGRDGTKVLYTESRNAPRVAVELVGATHCFVPFPLASECGLMSGRQQRSARWMTVAFLNNYLKDDPTHTPFVWGEDLIRAPGSRIASVGRDPALAVRGDPREVLMRANETRTVRLNVRSAGAPPPPTGWVVTLAVSPIGRRLVGDVAIDARLRAEGVDASSGDNSVRLYTSPGVADVVLSTPVDAREGMGQRVKVTVESDGTIAHDTLAVRVI